MAEENTHSLAVAGAAGTTAAETTIGTITLPADGPWKIHTVWAQVANATATAAEATALQLRVASLQGDVEPNPAPALFPLYASGSSLGATIDVIANKLQMWDVDWDAPGRATINMNVLNVGLSTVAPQVVCGLMFGRSIPDKKRIRYSDTVRGTITAAADTSIGTMTLSERATRITGLCGLLVQDNVLTTAEELIGFWRMTSDDINILPALFPFNNAFSAGLGALINGAGVGSTNYIPVDIPIVGGARIQFFVDLNTAVTNAAECAFFVAYE
jgi:hypothetical protein